MRALYGVCILAPASSIDFLFHDLLIYRNKKYLFAPWLNKYSFSQDSLFQRTARHQPKREVMQDSKTREMLM
jgi:hypothetical protein